MNNTTKIMAFAIAATLALASNGVEKLHPKTVTEAQFKAAFDHLMTIEDEKYKRTADEYGFWTVSMKKEFAKLVPAMDDQLAKAGREAPPQYTVTWPKASALRRESLGWTTNFPVRLSIANRLGVNARYSPMLQKNVSYEECMDLLNEAVKSHHAFINNEEIKALVGGIKNVATKMIKRKMREQGLSFVEKDGVNPVAVKMQKLVDALNAPRFAGLNEWNQSLGISSRVDVSSLPSPEEIDDLKHKLLYGEVNMSAKRMLVLQLCLGVDGYNAFVKEYNGD